MEQVVTGRSINRLIIATTEEESTPPLRNAPSGTSLIKPNARGFTKFLPYKFTPFPLRFAAAARRRTVSNNPSPRTPRSADLQIMGGSQFVYILDRSSSERDIGEREVIADCQRVDSPWQTIGRQDRLQLGTKDQPAIVDIIIERLFANPIPR